MCPNVRPAGRQVACKGINNMFLNNFIIGDIIKYEAIKQIVGTLICNFS